MALGLLACSGARREGRQARLVSSAPGVDAALQRAERLAAEGELSRADQGLAELVRRHPTEGLGYLANLRRARIALAQHRLADAAARVAEVPRGVDEALDLQRDLIEGLLEARREEADRAVATLRRLDGRMIDRTQNVEVACGLLAMEPRATRGDAARALRAGAVIEQAREAGTRWLATGLSCDDAAERAAVFRALVAQVERPEALANTLDAMPDDHPLRVELARRLRAVAAARGETARWLHWLSDLRDDEATLLPVGGSEEREVFRVGVLAPLSGPESNVGAEIVRAVQLAVRGQPNLEVAVADEGESVASAQAGFAQLTEGLRCDAVIGPTREGHARAVSLAADAAGRPVYLVAPYLDAVPAPQGSTRLAGPGARDRAVALAAASRRVGTRVVLRTAPGDAHDEFVQRLRSVLQNAGVTALDAGPAALPRVVTGHLSHEQRAEVAHAAALAPARFILDARSGLAGTRGTWVGLGPGADFEEIHTLFCGLTGRPPGELALLAYDATWAAIASARGVTPHRTLQPGWAVHSVTVRTDAASSVAVSRRCAQTVPPAPTSGDPYARE